LAAQRGKGDSIKRAACLLLFILLMRPAFFRNPISRFDRRPSSWFVPLLSRRSFATKTQRGTAKKKKNRWNSISNGISVKYNHKISFFITFKMQDALQ
jgi:hypothetical protein